MNMQEKIAAIRKLYTQEQIGNILGIRQDHVSRIASGKYKTVHYELGKKIDQLFEKVKTERLEDES